MSSSFSRDTLFGAVKKPVRVIIKPTTFEEVIEIAKEKNIEAPDPDFIPSVETMISYMEKEIQLI